MRLFSIACATVAFFAATPALALTTIDFSTSPAVFTTYSQGGATVSAVGGGTTQTTSVPGGSQGILTTPSTNFPEFRVDFASVASFLSVDLGDFNADPDLLFIEAYNSSNAIIGFTSFNNPASATTMTTLSLSVANIKYALFGARAPALSGNSVYADNVRFELGATQGAVPEPSTWAFMLAGFGMIGGVLRRRRNVSVSFA
jgi:PEP-CTERM motif